MKRSRDCSMSLVGAGFLLASALVMSTARADFTFGEPVNIELPKSLFDGANDDIDCFSSDGLEMYIDSFRPGGLGDFDLWVLRRASVDDEWGLPENLGPTVNSTEGDYFASISNDGLSLYFCSWRGASFSTGHDIYVTTRATKDSPWGPPVNLGPSLNSSTTDGDPWISPDGLELYLGSGRSGGYGNTDIYVAKRTTTDDPWGDPVNIGPEVNSSYRENFLSLSPDGLLLFFCDYPFSDTYARRPGGYGGADIWMARRASLSDSWQTPVNLGPIVNTSANEGVPRISPDGRTIYFYSTMGDVPDSYQAPIRPIVDFNGDETVDAADIEIMIDCWGTDESLCDIGPFPWGDGVVDVEDLVVLVEYIVAARVEVEDTDAVE